MFVFVIFGLLYNSFKSHYSYCINCTLYLFSCTIKFLYKDHLILRPVYYLTHLLYKNLVLKYIASLYKDQLAIKTTVLRLWVWSYLQLNIYHILLG